MEANPHAIHLGDDDEYTVTKPARGPPPPASHAKVAPMGIAENPHAISLNNNDYSTGSNEYGQSTKDEYGQTNPVPRDKKNEGKTTKKVCTAKVFMCAFAIGFLWLTTFGAAQGFVNAVIKSNVTPKDVLLGWNETFYDSRRVKDNFESCIVIKNDLCLDELNVTTLNELQRGIDVQTGSEKTIAMAQERLAQCQAKNQQKHQAIKLWMEALSKVGKQWRTTPQCQNNSLYGEFLKIADGNTTENADAQARSLTKQYQAALGAMAASTRDAFAVRAAYNAEWASNHTPNLLRSLSLNATKIPVPNFTLAGAFAYLTPADLGNLTDIKKILGPEMNDTWNSLVVSYANAKQQAEIMQNATLQYQREYAAAVANMTKYVQDTQQWLGKAKATIEYFSGSCSYNVLPSIDVSNPDLPGFPTLPNLGMTGFNVTVSDWDANLNNKLAAYKAASQAKADRANAEVKAYFANLDTKPDWFDCFACDYNPPPLLFPSEGEQEESDANFNNQLSGLLTNLGDAADSAQVGGSKLSNETVQLPTLEFIQAQRSKADLKFANLSGDPDFTNILSAFASISSLFLIMDYLYRAFRSVSLIIRYWFGSAVGLPDVEVQKQDSADVAQPIGVRILTFVTSPPFVLTVVGFLVFGLVYVLLELYLPIVNEYVDGCASPQKENGPGTLISRNAYALVYNNAVGPGQKDMQKHLTDYDTLRQSICGQYVSQTGNTQQQLQAILTATLQAYKSTYDDLELMKTCMSTSTNNFNFDTQTNGPGTTGQNFNDATSMIIPFTMTAGPQANRWNDNAIPCGRDELANVSTIEDMTFVCGNVSLCMHMGDCTAAIDTPVLKRGTWKSSCDSEKIVLVGITAAGFSVFVYIMWNLGRIFLVMGLGRMLWRHLVPHGFNYLATCSTDGRIARDTEKEVTVALGKMISAFERWGMIYLGFAVFLQLVWIIPIAVFSQQIASIST